MDSSLDSQQSPDIIQSLTQPELDSIMCLRRSVENTLSKMCNFHLTEKPRIERRAVIRWQNQMRILKPPEYHFVAVIGFRHSNVNIEKYEVHGITIMYLTENTVEMLLKALQITVDMNDPDDVLDGCGEFLNIIAGSFKSELVSAGYEELDMSVPAAYMGQVAELYNYRKSEVFRIIFPFESQPFIEIELGLDSIKKVK